MTLRPLPGATPERLGVAILFRFPTKDVLDIVVVVSVTIGFGQRLFGNRSTGEVNQEQRGNDPE